MVGFHFSICLTLNLSRQFFFHPHNLSGSVETLTESFDQEADKDCPKTGFISVRSKEKLDYEARGCCCSRWTKTKICGVTFLGCVVVTLIGIDVMCGVWCRDNNLIFFSYRLCGWIFLTPTNSGRKC